MVNDMTRVTRLTFISMIMVALSACGDDVADGVAENNDDSQNAPDVAYKTKDDATGGAVVAPGAPFKVSYDIIGTPVVGSPVTVNLQVLSLLGAESMNLEYRFKDPTALMFAESQPSIVRTELAANEEDFRQQVTIIPQREGRFYLNVATSYETDGGTLSTITAIPIQVGAGMRELEQHGEVQIDEDGEAVRVLSND